MIEVYVDTSNLTQNQSLVVVDDVGRRWDVADSVAAESSPKSNRAGGRYYEVMLERWTIELGDVDRYKASQLNDQLPNVYKKGVLLFRSLYTYARFLPAWKLHRRLSRQPSNAQPLKLRFRIRQGRTSAARLSKDALNTPLCPPDINNTKTTEHHDFAPLLCSAGPLSISLDYRTNADLTVADAEALLSSRFAGLDAGLARYPGGGRSLPGGHRHSVAQEDDSSSLAPTGSTRAGARVAGGGAYGSLGTFHATGKRESPVSALRHRAASGASDTAPSPERRVTPQSIPTTTAGMDYIKNPPFKAGSVASSPRTNAASPSPSTSAPRPSPLTGTSAHSKRLSLNTLPQQALRNPGGIPQDMAIASSGSTSPKPAPVHRYSSSFAGRKRWTSTSQSSRAGESATSSGRASSSSSKEKSGGLATDLATGASGSPGSGRTDEDDIAAFISTVERAKDLKAFSTRKPAPHNNVVNLSRFKNMSLASSELADEMSSSSLVQASLTPPSRRLSNVPGLSTSSSPSRMQPHAPHVRSRLSTQSIAEEISSEKGRKPEREVEEEDEAVDEEESDDDEPFIFQQDNIL